MEPEHRTIVILSVGCDTSLLSTRHMVLQSAGYVVESTASITRALKSVREGDFDLVVVCHSLPERERTSLTSGIREAGSAIPVILLSAMDVLSSNRFANDMSSGSEPFELLHNIESALRLELRERAK